jgi:hypothetical protein
MRAWNFYSMRFLAEGNPRQEGKKIYWNQRPEMH